MLKQIACDIEDKVIGTGFIRKHFPWVELVQRDGKTFPGQYTAKDQYEHVLDIDVNGHSYLRKSGKVSFSPADVPKMLGCLSTPFIMAKVPLKLVVAVPRVKLTDDAFSDERLAFDLMGILSGVQEIDGLSGISAIDIEYVVTDYDTDSLSVWKSEVTGVDYQMNFRYAYISLGFTVNLTINPACIAEACTY